MYLSGELDRVSKLITDRIFNLDAFLNAKNVMLYYPLKSEINLLGLFESKDKNFYFPKCDKDNLLVCPCSSLCEDFEENKFKIKEPKSAHIEDISHIDIIFVPALCVDKSLYRLGWGAGFYDRFFSSSNSDAKKIAVISEKLICEKLPADEHDIPCDMAVFEDGVMIRG